MYFLVTGEISLNLSTEDIAAFVKVAKILVCQDETERALMVLNNLPAFYRDHEPSEITELRSKIQKMILLPLDCLFDNREFPKSKENNDYILKNTERGQFLKQFIEVLNADSKFPALVELGPGDFSIPLAIKDCGLKFKYASIGVNIPAREKAKELFGDYWSDDYNPSDTFIYVCFEVMEHLSNISDIRTFFERIAVKPEVVFMSVPLYTFNLGTPNWEKEGIHHLRAYTPKEFFESCEELFPEYEFNYNTKNMLVGIGFLRGKK